MKNTCFSFLIFLFSISFYGQTQIDSLVSVRFPGLVIKVDTVIKGLKTLNFVSNNGNETFMVLKAHLDPKKSGFNDLPSDAESLKEYYLDCIKGCAKTMKANGLSLAKTSEFKIDNYTCYKTIGVNAADKNKKITESVFIILNDNIYLLSYFNYVDFNEKNNSAFMNSVKIDSSLKPSQTLGKSGKFKFGDLFGPIFGYALFIGLIIFLIIKYKKK